VFKTEAMNNLKNIEIGLGCMPLTGCYGKVTPNTFYEIVKQSFDLGVRLFDTADNYGDQKNEKLLAEVITPFRNDIVLATKIGICKTPDKLFIDGSKSYIKTACEKSLLRLQIDEIDLLYYHHLDDNIPIEETMQAMSELVLEGKIKKIGLFEMPLEVLKRAQVVHPIAAYQAEYSLITRGVEKEILPFCKKQNITFIANAPLGRGLLVNKFEKLLHLEDHDIRKLIPRFQNPNLEKNLEMLKKLRDFAKENHFTLSQLALAWLRRKSVIPLFGTTSLDHLKEDLNAISLSQEIYEDLEKLLSKIEISGARVPGSLKKLYL
jgi:aryl-alcohol dehydrogenase-like predicted oxidoreductase